MGKNEFFFYFTGNTGNLGKLWGNFSVQGKIMRKFLKHALFSKKLPFLLKKLPFFHQKFFFSRLKFFFPSKIFLKSLSKKVKKFLFLFY